MGGSCGRGADGAIRGLGWIQEGDSVGDLTAIEIEPAFRPGSILHTGFKFKAKTAAGKDIAIDGKVEGMCPTKIPFPGGATFVNEGLASFTLDGKKGTGIIEAWHNVVE